MPDFLLLPISNAKGKVEIVKTIVIKKWAVSKKCRIIIRQKENNKSRIDFKFRAELSYFNNLTY